jgi:predicted transcriptional regulator
VAASKPDEAQAYRPAVRLAASYFLDSAERMVRFSGQDLGPCLVFMGTVWANVSWAAEAAGEGPPPAEVERRPVSIYRLADNLSIPYETVRRHVARLVEAGFLVRDQQGVVAPPEVFMRRSSLEVLEGTWASTVRFRRDLEAVGVELPAPAATVAPQARAWVGRLSAAFVLHGVDLITQALRADPVSALIFLAINRENLADLLADRQRAQRFVGPDAIVPDELRKPTSVYRIARVLGLPYETARRHVVNLVQAGWLERTSDGGLITLGASLTHPAMLDASLKAWPLVRRFMDRMASLGVGGSGQT